MKKYNEDVLNTFLNMIQVDSESFFEEPMVDFLSKEIARRGWQCKTEVQEVSVGNLTEDLQLPFTEEERKIKTKQLAVVIEANDDTKEPIYLCAHIDTVSPGKNVKPVVEEDVIRSDGTTILGGDDKSGVAAIVCGVDRIIKENKPHGKIVLLFVALEERGHIGAIQANVKKFGVNYGFVFDTMFEVGRIVRRDQYGRVLRCTLKAKQLKNHTMSCLDNNSLTAAVDLCALLPKKVFNSEDFTFTQIARLDNTYDAGYMVPKQTDIKYVVRSFDEKAMENLCAEVEKTLNAFSMDNVELTYTLTPKLTNGFDMNDYPRGKEIMDKAEKAIKDLGLKVEYVTTGLGGHDSSAFLHEGVPSVVLSSGMRDIHTTHEYIYKKDLFDCADLVAKLIENA